MANWWHSYSLCYPAICSCIASKSFSCISFGSYVSSNITDAKTDRWTFLAQRNKLRDNGLSNEHSAFILSPSLPNPREANATWPKTAEGLYFGESGCRSARKRRLFLPSLSIAVRRSVTFPRMRHFWDRHWGGASAFDALLKSQRKTWLCIFKIFP